MEDILQTIFSETGVLGLLAVSGWVVYYFERQERIEKDKHLVEIIEKMLSLNAELKDTLEDVLDNISIKDMLRQYIDAIK